MGLSCWSAWCFFCWERPLTGSQQKLRSRWKVGSAGKRYTAYTYAGVNHAFNNDTNAARYDAHAAKLAWQRTLAFLAANLGA